MKKILVLLFMSLSLLGCQSKKDEANYKERYENYMELLIDNNDETSTNIPFSWELQMTEVNETKYQYALTIKNPKVAMYNIRMVAVDLNEIGEDEMAPTLGIVEDEKFNMIPNQVNLDKNYYGGIVLTSSSSKSQFRIHACVSYLDKNQNENYVYFHVDANYDDFKEVEENQEEVSDVE